MEYELGRAITWVYQKYDGEQIYGRFDAPSHGCIVYRWNNFTRMMFDFTRTYAECFTFISCDTTQYNMSGGATFDFVGITTGLHAADPDMINSVAIRIPHLGVSSDLYDGTLDTIRAEIWSNKIFASMVLPDKIVAQLPAVLTPASWLYSVVGGDMYDGLLADGLIPNGA